MEQTRLRRGGRVVSRIAADVRVTLLDTAQGYGFGASGRPLAKALGRDCDGPVGQPLPREARHAIC